MENAGFSINLNAKGLANYLVAQARGKAWSKLQKIVTILVCSLCIGCANVPSHDEFTIGMKKQEISKRFGEADYIQDIVKTTPYIFGPIEEIWDRLEMGSRVEIWAYESDGGHVELYFIDESDSVGGIGFSVKEAVY